MFVCGECRCLDVCVFLWYVIILYFQSFEFENTGAYTHSCRVSTDPSLESSARISPCGASALCPPAFPVCAEWGILYPVPFPLTIATCIFCKNFFYRTSRNWMLIGNWHSSLCSNLLSCFISTYQLYVLMGVVMTPSYMHFTNKFWSYWLSISFSFPFPLLWTPFPLPCSSAFCFCAFIVFLFVVTQCISLEFSVWGRMRGCLQEREHLAGGCTPEENVSPTSSQ